MKKILPLAPPMITTFPSYAAALGIMAYHKEAYDWIYSQYIQLCTVEITNAYKDKNTHSPYIPTFFVDTDTRRLTNTFSDYYFVMRENCPYLNIFETANEFIDLVCGSFISYIRSSINLDMYIFTFLDVSKIGQYKKLPSGFHEIFIYGYDDEKEVVYFADFPINNTMKYSYSTCSYSEIEAAYISMNQLEYPVTKSSASIKYTQSVPYNFDISYVKDSISKYIYPDMKTANDYNNYIMSLFYKLGWKTKTYVGIDVYDFLNSYINSEKQLKFGHLSIELFHGLYDHKEMMVKRFNYIVTQNHLTISNKLLLEYNERVRNRSLIIRNSVIKYNLSKKEHILNDICKLLDKTKQAEIELLKRIFNL